MKDEGRVGRINVVFIFHPFFLGSGQHRIDHDIAGDPDRALVGVALAFDARVSFQSAADVESRVDNNPVVVDLDALELREVLAAASRLGVLHFREIDSHPCGKELIIAWDGDQWIVGEQLGDEAPERRIESGRAASSVGEDGSSTGVKVSTECVEIFPTKTQGRTTVDIDERVIL